MAEDKIKKQDELNEEQLQEDQLDDVNGGNNRRPEVHKNPWLFPLTK